MTTKADVLKLNPRLKKPEVVAELANAVAASDVAVRSCDPIQAWEVHPVVSLFLDLLNDREVAAAIDLANAVEA